MNRKYRILTIVFLGLIYSLLIEGCCTEKYKLIGSGELEARISNEVTNTITKGFWLYFSPEVEMVFNFKEISLISSAHALTCDESYDYEMLESTVTLKCDKNFSYNNELVLADSDFLHLGDLLKYFSQRSISFNLDDLFLSKCDFDNSNYVFYVEIETSDGIVLKGSVDLLVNL